MKASKNKLLNWSLIIFEGIVLVELFLRLLGLGNAVLYEESALYEYNIKANQNLFRFGHFFQSNSFGMRSKQIDSAAIKVIKIGDSVVHGGILTDNSSLSTSVLSSKLSNELSAKIQVLNISCGSWGPDNGLAYLNEKGNFEAVFMIMVYSSHDWYDSMTYSPIVGYNLNYPKENFTFAFSELYNRYLKGNSRDFYKTQIAPKTESPNMGFTGLIEYCKSNNIEVLGYLHPEISELNRKEYSKTGNKILQFWKSHNITVVEGINYMSQDCYRDNIHLNSLGQQKMAEAVYPHLYKFLKNK